MKVLYIDGVGPFGGASRSLYEVVRALPKGSVEAYFVVARGTILTYYGELAKDVIATTGLTRFDNTRYSHYRGVRWLVVLREAFHLPFTILALLKARLRWGSVDVIHANEITEILPLLIAGRLFNAPVVVHVRSLARVDDRSMRCRWLNARLRKDADAVVAIDENVRATLPADVPVEVIHNSFTPEHAGTPDVELLGRLASLRPASLKIGFIGNLHRSKGMFELLEAARIVRAAGHDVEYLIVGGATRRQRGLKSWMLERLGLAQDVQAELPDRLARYGLTDSFHLFGATSDIQRVYESIDVLCFPSHFDAPGRPVFEAAFSGVPSIVAVRSPRPDTLVPGETGIAVPGHDPVKLAEAVAYFAESRAEVGRMGANARRLATRNFDPRTNAIKLLEVYARVVRAAARIESSPATSSDQHSVTQ